MEEIREKELKELKRKVSEFEKARIDLSLCLKESGEKILKDDKAREAFKEQLLNQNKDLIQKNQELTLKLEEAENSNLILQSDIMKIKAYIKTLESDINILRANLNNEESLTTALKKLNLIMKEVQNNNRKVILPV